eukprot:TRINITY_DN79576_c0_g1_i1.p1 TRINITY_DN79576_c0_g1~~TRINITY_DN79576_c0_g1_i1.p1  ORF type:complete len:253 (+),score=-5.43 TRINITY_DN79576_c0_g1_i1:122-880(+)
MVYNYTKPRGPIAAMYSSPGPCYGLPGLVGQSTHDPRSVHQRGPAYPFGVRHGKFKDDCSPGPAHFPNSKIYRDGPDGTPHYSLYGRQKDPGSFPVPGPGAYSPEKAGKSAQPSPAEYSFGIRHKHKRTDNTPAPNCYTLPNMLGTTRQSGKRQAPCYSMTGRNKIGGFHQDLQKTPGPGTYAMVSNNIDKMRAPIYSMTSRNVMPGDTTQKPGPGAHSPEKQFPTKRLAPQFSFGIKHSQYTAPLIIDPID